MQPLRFKVKSIDGDVSAEIERDAYRVDLQVYRERLAYHFVSRIINLATNDLSFEADQVVVFYTNWKAVRKDVVAEASTAKGLPVPYPLSARRAAEE